MFSVELGCKTKLALKIHNSLKCSDIKQVYREHTDLPFEESVVSRRGYTKLCPNRKTYLHWSCSEARVSSAFISQGKGAGFKDQETFDILTNEIAVLSMAS